jgi:DNA primase
MALFTQESLTNLRQRIDLVEVIEPHVDLKRAGAVFKGLCPFHDEKTSSFTVSKGDNHYHCFGCGAHGDAIEFLMEFLKLGFYEAVEQLAQRFGVHLDRIETGAPKGPPKSQLKEALALAGDFFHLNLLHTSEGHQALKYMYGRGLTLEFIRHFEIGLAPKREALFLKYMEEKGIKTFILKESGLAVERRGLRSFFSDRITFPIRDAMGAIIGFSGRKYNEDTFGGKYVNTPETPLFKKSRVLYGLNYCRRDIAKQQQVIIVEGQVDALRLIHAGFTITVAGQGTAFTADHAQELIRLGIRKVFLALDGDEAGEVAATKIGDLFQREGIEVVVLPIPSGSDPDTLLNEEGPDRFAEILEKGKDYLTFLVEHHSRFLDASSPAGKTELVATLTKQIRGWSQEVMVHESLKRLASLLQVPEEIIGIDHRQGPVSYIRQSGSVGGLTGFGVDPNRVLEGDALRWLLVTSRKKPELAKVLRDNLKEEDFKVTHCRGLFRAMTEAGDNLDTLTLASTIDEEGQVVLAEVLDKKINPERAEQQVVETVQKILERNWMLERDAIHQKIKVGGKTDEEMTDLLKAFGELQKNRPKVYT